MERKKITTLILVLVTVMLQGFVFVNLVDTKGNMVNLRTSVEGKVVLMNFFATTCIPCKNELPELRKFYEANSKTFKIIFISEDGSDVASEAVEGFLKEHFGRDDITIYRDVYHQQYQLNAEKGAGVSIPRNVLLKNGDILLDVTGFHEDTILSMEKQLQDLIQRAKDQKPVKVHLVYSSVNMGEEGEKTKGFVKAFCAGKKLLLSENMTEDTDFILKIELKTIGAYKLCKINVLDKQGKDLANKSSVIYQDTEITKKVSDLLNEAVNTVIPK